MRRALLAAALLASVAHADPQQRIDAIVKDVSKLRGLPLKKPITHETIDRDTFHARVVSHREPKAALARVEGLALERWGLVPPGTDYHALMIALVDSGIAGYYDAKTATMTLVGPAIADSATWADMVFAHELQHALQDQAFGLDRFETAVADSDGDALLARRSLVEGDGIAVMVELMQARLAPADVAGMWMNPQIADMIEKELSLPGKAGDALDAAPLAVREAMTFPYRAGFLFVAALRRHQPWSVVDAAFKQPPRSSEHILHPERYLANEAPIVFELVAPTKALPAHAIVHSTVWGELGFQSLLRTHGIGAVVAGEASAGWGGDRTILLARPEALGDARRTVGISRSEWDTEVDAIEAYEALGRALDASIVGGSVVDRDRTTWLALDGTVSWVERRGAQLAVAIGVPAYAAHVLATEIWTIAKRKKG